MLSHLLASLRVILAITALVATEMLLAPAAPARAQGDQPDSIAAVRASAADARLNTWLMGALTSAPDRDWFAFRLDSPGIVQVTLGQLPTDYRLTLTDTGGRPLAVSDRAGTAFEQVQWRLQPGRYFVEVSPGQGAVATADEYWLLIRPLADRVVVLDSHPITADGLYAITGQLLNNTSSWRRYPRVTARFYDAGDRFLGESTALAAQSYLGPGQRGHFRIVADQPSGTVRYRLSVQAPETAAPQHPALTLKPDRPYPVGPGRVRYVGRVSGAAQAIPAHVHVVRYNRIGAFVDAGHAVLPPLTRGIPARYEIELPRYPYVRDERPTYSLG